MLDPDTSVDLTWAWPLPVLEAARPTVAKGWRSAEGADPHAGVDLAYRRGGSARAERYEVPDRVPVLAASGGRVRFAAETPRGYAVIVDHRDGRATHYLHLASVYVTRGEIVSVGQPLGLVGHDPTDPARVRHLHFELWPHGTRSSARDPSAFLDAWPMLRYTRGQGEAVRNVGWLGIKTPGLILNEMRITNEDVSALGRDVYATFRRPWEAQFDLARARFKKENGRDPWEQAEWATVYSWMTPAPAAVDVQWKTYQGAFVHSWGEFERDWGRWYIENMNYGARMWRGTYDQALDFRRRAKAWREQFQTLGGVPSSPAPHIPTEDGPLAGVPWTKLLFVAGGIAAAVFVLPPVIEAVRK